VPGHGELDLLADRLAPSSSGAASYHFSVLRKPCVNTVTASTLSLPTPDRLHIKTTQKNRAKYKNIKTINCMLKVL